MPRPLPPTSFQARPSGCGSDGSARSPMGVPFLTATANHPMDGLSTYPFAVFDADWFGGYRAGLPHGHDTVAGHDC